MSYDNLPAAEQVKDFECDPIKEVSIDDTTVITRPPKTASAISSKPCSSTNVLEEHPAKKNIMSQ